MSTPRTAALRRNLCILAAAAAAAAAAPPMIAQVTAGVAETVEVDVVTVDVRVSDRSGKPITGLTSDDFRLFEDGKPVDISHFTAISTGAPGPAAGPAASPMAAAPAPTAVADPAAMHLVVYVDDHHLQPAHRAHVLRQVGDFAATRLLPADRVSVVTDDLAMKVRLPFSTDRASLERVLTEVQRTVATGADADRDRSSTFENMIVEQLVHAKNGGFCGTSVVQPVRDYAKAVRADALRTLGRLRFVVNSLAGLDGRKALLYVSDGIPLNPGAELFQAYFELCGGGALRSGIPIEDELRPGDSVGSHKPGSVQEVMMESQSYGLEDELRRLAAHANTHGVTFYTLQASGLEAAGPGSMLGVDERLLQSPAVMSVQIDNLKQPFVYLATETGGRALLNGNDYGPDLVRMRDDLATYYSLGFAPSHHGDGKEHRLEVRLNQPGARLDYRHNYRDKPPIEQTVDRTLAALMHGFADNPLEVTLEPGEPTDAGDGTISIPLHLRIPLFRLTLVPEGDTYTGKLRLLVVTCATGGEPSRVRQVEVPLTVAKKDLLTAFGQYYQYDLTLRLTPGEQRVAVTVRDDLSTLASHLARSLDVARPLPISAATTP